MRVVMLIENTAVSQKLFVEHGMSLFVENKGGYTLFGTGFGSKLINNAKRMKLPMEKVTKAVIPHNHFSYTGGIDNLLITNPDMKIYALRAANCKPVQKKGFLSDPMGDLQEKVKKHRDSFVLFKAFQQIDKGFFLLKDEIKDKSFYIIDKNAKIKRGESYVPDEMDHECFAAVFPGRRKTDGCVIIGGCAHCGIPNMVGTVRRNWGDVPILSIISGMHFISGNAKKMTVDSEFIQRTAEEIKKLDVGVIYTCHCTGLKGYEELKIYLGNQLQYLQTGEELNF